MVGDAGFTPKLADTWQWYNDSLAIAFHLNSKAKWHDGRSVRADDIIFTFSLYSDSTIGASSREQLLDIDSVTAVDSLTAAFWFKKRSQRQFFDATNQMLILPRHIYGAVPRDSLVKVAGDMQPIGSGRYRYRNWKHGELLELNSDSANYRGAAKIRRLIWSVTPSAPSAVAKLFAGEVDFFDNMRPENVIEAAQKPNVRIHMSLSTDYYFLRFNLRDPERQSSPHPIFASRDLRRALSMAADRQSMVKNVLGSFANTGLGPTISAYPSTDPNSIEELPYDPARAMRILDSIGWRVNPRTQVRERAGRKLHFRILTPSTSVNRHRMAVLLQEQFRKVGVVVDLDEVDFSTFLARGAARDFDTEFAQWHLGPSPGAVKETWTTQAARNKGGNNYGWYSNPAFDAYVDSAGSVLDSAASRRYYSRAYSIANQDAPAIWMYEPRMILGINQRIRGHVRPDAWWAYLSDWSIPEKEQIARDRIH